MLGFSSRPVPRRRFVRGALGGFAVVAAGIMAGCEPGRRVDPAQDTGSRWHDGRLYLATGNTTGVYYQIGGGYADVITNHLPGYEATAEPTNASVENIRRVAEGDSDIGFTYADAAADAVAGRTPFTGPPLAIVALARIYSSYAHVIARTGLGIRGLADLRGRRVSTGSPGSGSEFVALRLLAAAGLRADRDIKRQSLSLPETVKWMRAGSLDAMLWTSGLPAIGITDLLADAGDRVSFVPVVDLLGSLRQQYGEAYTAATIGRVAYGQPADVP